MSRVLEGERSEDTYENGRIQAQLRDRNPWDFRFVRNYDNVSGLCMWGACVWSRESLVRVESHGIMRLHTQCASTPCLWGRGAEQLAPPREIMPTGVFLLNVFVPWPCQAPRLGL